MPNLGHGQAGHYPDWPVIWEDQRLQEDFCTINNQYRFYAATIAIGEKLDRFINPRRNELFQGEAMMGVVDKIFEAFGEVIPSQERKNSEIEILSQAQMNNFRNLGRDREFGGLPIRVYDDDEWQKAATHVEVRGFEDGWFSRLFSNVFSDPLPDRERWQSTYYADFRAQFLDTNAPVKLFDVTSEKIFKTFPVKSKAKEWPQVVQDITQTHYYNFHVAAQTHLAHLVHETELRMVAGENDDDEKISLYQYYDQDDEQEWVGEMKARTLAHRQAIYGDDD